MSFNARPPQPDASNHSSTIVLRASPPTRLHPPSLPCDRPFSHHVQVPPLVAPQFLQPKTRGSPNRVVPRSTRCSRPLASRGLAWTISLFGRGFYCITCSARFFRTFLISFCLRPSVLYSRIFFLPSDTTPLHPCRLCTHCGHLTTIQ